MRSITLALALLFATAMLVGCAPSGSGSASSQSLSSLPATVDGVLIIDMAEGDVAADGTTEIHAATLRVGGDEIAVKVSRSIMHSAGVAATGGKVRATLSSKSAQSGTTVYTVSSLERL
jgi:hypothetical protein